MTRSSRLEDCGPRIDQARGVVVREIVTQADMDAPDRSAAVASAGRHNSDRFAGRNRVPDPFRADHRLIGRSQAIGVTDADNRLASD